MRRPTALALLLGVLLAGGAQAAPTPSPTPELEAGRGVDVTPDPASTHRSRSGSFLELGTVRLGTAIEDAVVVRSTFDTPQVVEVYAADAKPAVGGGFGFDARNDPATEVGAWLTPGRSRVTVPPMGQVRVTVRVLVPQGAEGGEYVGGVIAEAADQGQTSAVQTRTRFAMAVYLRVPGGSPSATPGRGKPAGRLVILDISPHFDSGRACPVVRARNDSQDIIDPHVTVRSSGLLGAGSAYTRRRSAALLPGAEAEFAVPCIQRPVGPGSVTVTLDSPRGGGAKAIDYRWLPLPFLLALLLLLLLIAALVATFLRGLLKRRERDPSDAPPIAS